MLELISEFLDKQELISKLTEGEKLHGMGFSDVHIIVAVGSMEYANVTKVSENMHMTRSAISKAMKRLERNGCVIRYTQPDNQKEIYFRLTEFGENIVKEHDKRHKLWEKQDNNFLSQYTKEEQNFLMNFFKGYNEYLSDKIEELEGKR